jgi:hypothetical protein
VKVDVRAAEEELEVAEVVLLEGRVDAFISSMPTATSSKPVYRLSLICVNSNW